MTTEKQITDAVERAGYREARVVRQYVQPRFETVNQDGAWYCLFVTFRDGMEPQLWGRRRTLEELLALAQRGPLL